VLSSKNIILSTKDLPDGNVCDLIQFDWLLTSRGHECPNFAAEPDFFQENPRGGGGSDTNHLTINSQLSSSRCDSLAETDRVLILPQYIKHYRRYSLAFRFSSFSDIPAQSTSSNTLPQDYVSAQQPQATQHRRDQDVLPVMGRAFALKNRPTALAPGA